MATLDIPTKQKRFLHDVSSFINLGKKESQTMNDLCRFFTFGQGAICLDQANTAVHLLSKNGNGLYVKRQTLKFKSKYTKPESIEKFAGRMVNRIKNRKMTAVEKEQFWLMER